MSNEEPKISRRFLLPLGVATFAIGLSNSIVTLFATDIAKTFFGSATAANIGSVSQLSTINSLVEVLVAILLSVLVIRFRQKSLLLTGIVLILFSAVGSYLAPSLLVLQLFFALEGAGSIIISVIAMTLIAEALAPGIRAKVIGYMLSIGAGVTLLLFPVIGFVTATGGWRFGLLVFVLPISILGLVLSLFMVKSKPIQMVEDNTGYPYVSSFKKIFKSRSATACLIANVLTIAGTEVAIFALAFYRYQFAATSQLTVMIFEFSIVLFFVAPIVSGRLVSKFGAKKMSVTTTLLAAIFTSTFFFVSDFWLALSLDMVHVWFAAMALPAFACLVLEQVPEHRGTMFSLNTLFNNIGRFLAPLIGGTLLAFSAGTYSTVGLALGSITVIGCLILFFLVKDNQKLSPL